MGIGNRQARRPVAVAAAGLETALAKRRRIVVTVVTAPNDDAGDLPEDVFAELALDGPVQGPAGRVASIRDPKHSRLKVVYQGRSIQEIMQVLEMVPCRQAMLWEAPTMRPLDGTVPDDLMEIYSPNRMVAEAQKLGLKAELSIDLLTGWNLLDMEVQVRVVQEIKARRPKVLMMSPPCTWFSGVMNMNWSRITPVVREQALRDATLHLEFCMLLADLQESSGRGWALEHPDSAKSWQNQKVMSIMQRGPFLARFDQCMFGLVSEVEKARMRKRTGILTNIGPLYHAFNRRFCDQKHAHVMVHGEEGGEKRSVWAQRYPHAMCETAVAAFAVYCRTDH